jgi:hypothetical protein
MLNQLFNILYLKYFELFLSLLLIILYNNEFGSPSRLETVYFNKSFTNFLYSHLHHWFVRFCLIISIIFFNVKFFNNKYNILIKLI